MPDAPSRLMIQRNGEITIIQFLDRNILDEANIQQIGEEIASIIDAAGDPKLVLSFDNVDHLSSAALGTLITINNKIRAKQGQLRLANINQQIYEVFTITKLDKLFNIDKSTGEAVEKLS